MDNELLRKDREHLKLLSIFHYVVAGLTALFACFPIIHLIIGLAFVLNPGTFEAEGDMPPAFFGWFFVIFPALFILMGWAMAVLIFAAGRSLARQRRYTFCLVVAGLECLMMPFGTVLGVFTLVVLMRDSVKQAFAAHGRVTDLKAEPISDEI